MSSFKQLVPLRNANLWKGVGLGVALCALALAIAIPNLMRSKVATYRMSRYTGLSDAKLEEGGGGGYFDQRVEADGPEIVRTAELALLVGDCAAGLKKIEDLAAAENGFIESSMLEENSANVILRVPSSRLNDVRARLREFGIRVMQDSVKASDVSKQYYDLEARLRNLRAQEQQFLEIMKKAHTVPDVLAVTKNLSEVRGQIEQGDTDFRRMKDQVDLAKIEVHLRSQATTVVHWSAGSSTRSAWNDLLQSLSSVADFLIWLVINIPVILLWIVIVFLLAAAGWYVLRAAIRAMRAIFGRKSGAEPVKA